MTMKTASAETAPMAASPDEAPRFTAWDNMGDVTTPADIGKNGQENLPLPPSIQPQNKNTFGVAPIPGGYGLFPYKVEARSSGPNLPDNIIDTRFAQNAGERTSADAGMSYEDKGRQIIAGATERARAGSKELFGRAKAGIKGIAGKLVRLARGGAKTAGEAVAKGASVAVGFAAIEGPKAAKATAEKASEVREKSAQKISELAEGARSRREERKNKRAAAKAEREREYGERQNARKKKLGEIAARAQEIKDDSERRITGIETDKADISDKKAELKRQEVAAKAAKSKARKAERRLKRLETKKEKAQDKYDRAKEASDNNPDNIRAQAALKRAKGNLEAAKLLYNAESDHKTKLDSKREDGFSEVDRSRQELRELRDRVADAKRDNNDGRVERLENAASSAFTRVAEFVDGPTAAHGLLRRAGQAIRRKLQGSGNRQEAKTA